MGWARRHHLNILTIVIWIITIAALLAVRAG